jgi:hypothetical protein
MHLIPKETVVSILGHLSERERIRLLSTCKRLREWLKERLTIARVSFDAFKVHCTTVGWTERNQLSVGLYEDYTVPRGTVHESTIASLQENGLIRIGYTRTFTSYWGVSHHSDYPHRFFTQWFHELTSYKGKKERASEPDSVVRMLLDASPRLV